MLRLLLFALLFPTVLSAQPTRWVVQSATSLVIHGRTNVNRFRCQTTGASAADTLYFSRSTSEPQEELVRGSIRINTRLFECGNVFMTADFKRTLRVKEYPELRIGITKIVSIAASNGKPACVTAALVVTVAGRSKQALVNCTLDPNGPKQRRLQGKHQFTFQDFGLTPPTRLLGTVKVDDSLDVSFDVYLVER